MDLLIFLADLIFFIWFGWTLNSINRNTRISAMHAARHTKLLASLANAASPVAESAPEKS
jgi:TRAP-type C4-dicarboxylate transport system permease small subunit